MKTAMNVFCERVPLLKVFSLAGLPWVLRLDKIPNWDLCGHGDGAEQTNHSTNIVYKQPEKGTFCSPALWNVKYNPKHKTMKVVFKAQRKRMVIRPKIEQEQSWDKAVGSPDIQNSVYIIPFKKKSLFSQLWFSVWAECEIFKWWFWLSGFYFCCHKYQPAKSFKFLLEKLYKGLDECLVT